VRRLIDAGLFLVALACLSTPVYAQVATLHVFGAPGSAEGSYPSGGVVQAADGYLYGTTSSGGAFDAGTIFKIDTSGTLSTVYTFTGGADGGGAGDLTLGSDGNLYGTTTNGGGASGSGTIFKLDPAGNVTTLHQFAFSAEGALSGPLVRAADGNLYGGTCQGGTSGFGTIFKFDAPTSTIIVLYAFPEACAEQQLRARLLESPAGTFYGTINAGGPSAGGTVFRLVAATSELTTFQAFTPAEGLFPSGELVKVGAYFYGTTSYGGSNDRGTIYRLDASGNVTVLHVFGPADPNAPGGHSYTGLLPLTGGGFYGTTGYGSPGDSAVFELDAAGQFRLAHQFTESDGISPSRLIRASDGQLYGITVNGGPYDGGTLFRVAFGPERPLLAVAGATGGYGGTTTLAAALTSGGAPVSGMPISFTLNSVSVGSATTNAAGIATVTGVSLGASVVGFYPAAVTATFEGGGGLPAASASAGLTIGRASPVITWNPPTMLPGPLTAAQLSPTANVPGFFFAFSPGLGTVMPEGVHQLSVWFVPDDFDNYNTVYRSATLIVSSKALVTSPTNGATGVSPDVTVQWSSVPNVQAYYLYIGTTVGAKNLVDSGETLATSRLVHLPQGQTVYVRLWTKAAGVWKFSDTTFTTAIVMATLTSPANGATGVSPSTTFQWTSIQNVQTYYLYVGTSVGAKNIVDSGETLLTSRAVVAPVGRTIYVRLWTKVGGVWRYQDSTYVTAVVSSTITYPVNGAVNADLTQPITWTGISYAQKYYLYIGTTVGAKDLVDTGEITGTSRLVSNLPGGQTVYARMWTKIGGSWSYTDSTFSAAAVKSTMTSPANGATGVPTTVTIQWSTVPNVQAYYLYVGSTAGATNYVNSGETPNTSRLVTLPAATTVYVRVWAKVGGIWRYTDATFTTQ
jgi:uncharacterized repeat protein (TIGR03803 family)